ncbi:hypothetical protein EVAR_10793_1 [Eumeta japonica]|uniref:Uncharacterized protein n=1 Tax=Eumeta variegata TaxID=151549 RepID=A0A4C1W9K9_EUMVA|nr:hypothetical protein EVAR_10793_1 [Eumeta japonica]
MFTCLLTHQREVPTDASPCYRCSLSNVECSNPTKRQRRLRPRKYARETGGPRAGASGGDTPRRLAEPRTSAARKWDYRESFAHVTRSSKEMIFTNPQLREASNVLVNSLKLRVSMGEHLLSDGSPARLLLEYACSVSSVRRITRSRPICAGDTRANMIRQQRRPEAPSNAVISSAGRGAGCAVNSSFGESKKLQLPQL